MGFTKRKKRADLYRGESAVDSPGEVPDTVTELRKLSADEIRALAADHGIEYTNKAKTINQLLR